MKGLLVGAMLFGGATHAKPKAAYKANGHSKKSGTVAEMLSDLPVAEVIVTIDSFAAVPPYLAYDDLIAEAAEAFGIDEELIHAVIRTESAFNPLAESPVGAQGLMQLMPALQKDMGVTNPFDPRQNIMAGAKYLKRLLESHSGNVSLALASYNAGPGNVAKYKGIPPFQETQNYVKKITGLLSDTGDVAD
jgi:soluble lytic murein transglycosylase-like protein